MTSLLPDVVIDAVRDRGTYPASQSFGVVALVLLLALLVEWQALQAIRAPRGRRGEVMALSLPVLVAFAMVVGARLLPLLG